MNHRELLDEHVETVMKRYVAKRANSLSWSWSPPAHVQMILPGMPAPWPFYTDDTGKKIFKRFTDMLTAEIMASVRRRRNLARADMDAADDLEHEA